VSRRGDIGDGEQRQQRRREGEKSHGHVVSFDICVVKL
jgi:hypothetical protein